MARIVRMVNGLSKLSSRKWPIFKKYAAVELKPPGVSEIIEQLPKEVKQLVSKAQSQAWKNATVYETAINLAVCLEILCWFSIGECIGKRSHMGYEIPSAYNKIVDVG